MTAFDTHSTVGTWRKLVTRVQIFLHTTLVGARNLLHAPGFALAATLTLALGIGLSTAVFTVANALLLQRLPVHDQDRLVVLWGKSGDGRFAHAPLALRYGRDFSVRTRSLERMAYVAYEGAWPVVIRADGRMSRLRRALVSGEFFDVLGTRPALGRALNVTDDMRGAAPVVVLSHAAWQRWFGGDPGVVGRELVMHDNGRAYRVVGVMPQGFGYPSGVDFWATIVPARARPGTDSMFADVDMIGRLAPRATPHDAAAELTNWFARADASGWERDMRGVARPLPEIIVGDTKPALLAFAGASALLLLIACINVANLLLLRGLTRRREVAVRSALGAARAQIVALLLTESAVLAIAGGVCGVLVASLAVRAFVAFAPSGTPRLDEIQLNSVALLGAVAITTGAMLLFSVIPAITTSRVRWQQLLRADSRQTGGRASRLFSEVLVSGQIALAVLILSAAGVIGRSLLALENAEFAFEPAPLLIGDLALRSDAYDGVQKQMALLEQLIPELQAIPGVVSVSPVVAAPYSGSGGWDGKFATVTQSAEEASHNSVVNMEVVGANYFATLGIPIEQGRAFTDADRRGAEKVAIVSESMARDYWPAQAAIGQRLKMGEKAEPSFVVVGVVKDTRYRDLRDARPSIYFPLHQSIFPFAPTTLAIRTKGAGTTLIPAIRRVIEDAHAGVALASIAPYASLLNAPLAQPRLNALLLGVFAIAAVALAAVGLFGVIAAMVRQRTRELGVRMALGATASALRYMVLRRGLVLTASGLVAGLLAAVATNRLLSVMLYRVHPADALTLLAVVAVLLAVALVATFIPARASTRIDPAIALRVEG